MAKIGNRITIGFTNKKTNAGISLGLKETKNKHKADKSKNQKRKRRSFHFCKRGRKRNFGSASKALITIRYLIIVII